MQAKPQIICNHTKGPRKVSLILIDWGVRESFHSLDYLNRQTVPRSEYELIWVEFYQRTPAGLQRLVADCPGQPLLDKWIILGHPDNLLFHKHRLYNVGIMAAAGEVCVICDSDAIFQSTFVENILKGFEETPNAVIHLDQVRNEDQRYYPFRPVSRAEILGRGCKNWQGTTTLGLSSDHDRLHRANYGACMAARRSDLLAIGGADEHLDYLGFICGPYEMTFRLVNSGREERWLRNEYLYHLWHPNTSGGNRDYHGPHDGRFMSLRALHARTTGQLRPDQQNPWIEGQGGTHLAGLLQEMSRHPESTWIAGTQAGISGCVYWVDKGYQGFNIFAHANRWFALPPEEGFFDPEKARLGKYDRLIEAEHEEAIRTLIHEVPLISGAFRKFQRKVLKQPLSTLPGRMFRKAKKGLSFFGSLSEKEDSHAG